MIQYQVLQTHITRIVWQIVRRITNEILGVKILTKKLTNEDQTSYLYVLQMKFVSEKSKKDVKKEENKTKKAQINSRA